MLSSRRHFSGDSSIAFSADGHLVAVARGRGLTVWDLDRGQLLFSEPEAHTTTFPRLSSRPMAAGCFCDQEENLRLWDAMWA